MISRLSRGQYRRDAVALSSGHAAPFRAGEAIERTLIPCGPSYEVRLRLIYGDFGRSKCFWLLV